MFVASRQRRKMARGASKKARARSATPKPGSSKWTHRPLRTITTRSQRQNSGSFFTALPVEVFHIILDQLSVLELSVLCLLSKEMTSRVVNYISSLARKSKTVFQNFHNAACPARKCAGEHFRDLGVLFKRCTMLLPTKDRLKFILHKFLQVPCFMLEECSVPNCIGLVRYGVFLQVNNLGLKCFEELELRYFCRKVLLDLSPNQLDCQLWLLRLLKPWPLVHQAHLLLILYGPLLSEGAISWHDLVVRGLPQDALWDLARAILMLFNKPEVKDWTMQSTLAVFEEMTAIPQRWHLENIARLLVLCGTKLCYTVLASRASCGRLKEIAKVIVYIIVVCEKDGYQMTWAAKLVQQIHMGFSSAVEKFIFIHHLENMFSEVTREFYEFYVAGNRLDAGEAFGTLCLLLHSNAAFHAKFLHMLLK